MKKLVFMKKFLVACAVNALLVTTSSASNITLQLIDSYQRNDAFGLAFDGTNIWWSDSRRVVHEMTTSGVDTGNSFTGPQWSELAWNGSQLLEARGSTLYFMDRDGSNQSTQSITAPGYSAGLTDGLDWDQGELWISPDVSNVYRMNGTTDAYVGASPFLAGGGGYSGVERIQGTSQDFVVVVNDALNPRELCVQNLDASLVGCQQFANSRYEGLAFDGRYLWAADFFGNRIDKYDILNNGGSIIVSSVPVPAALFMFAPALLGFLGLRRKSKAV